MSKSKGHLWERQDLIRSVLLSQPIKARCGYEKTFTREDVDGSMHDGCKHCFAKVAKDDGGLVKFRSDDWAGTLERAWLDAHEQKPSYFTWTWRSSDTTTTNQWPIGKTS